MLTQLWSACSTGRKYKMQQFESDVEELEALLCVCVCVCVCVCGGGVSVCVCAQ